MNNLKKNLILPHSVYWDGFALLYNVKLCYLNNFTFILLNIIYCIIRFEQPPDDIH